MACSLFLGVLEFPIPVYFHGNPKQLSIWTSAWPWLLPYSSSCSGLLQNNYCKIIKSNLFYLLLSRCMVAHLSLLDCEITNDDTRCTADARRMKDELEKKYNDLSSVEKEADEFLKVLFAFVLFNTKDV